MGQTNSQGFTLIELSIVIAIIGFLAAIAVPAYEDYFIRAKLSEAIVTMSPCRAAVSDVYINGGTPPGANAWGCEGLSSKTVASLSTDVNGTVTAVIASGIHGNVDGRTVTLTPTVSGAPAVALDDMGKGVNGWICGGTGTNVNLKYLPGSCRGL
jgi:type IV pilus assembly protein PilA